MKKLFVVAALALGCCVLVKAQIPPTGTFPGPGVPTQNASPAGFYGQSLLFHYSGGAPGNFQPQGTPFKTYISIYDAHDKLVQRVVSNPVGQFYAYLKPGTYVLVPSVPGHPLPGRNRSQPPAYQPPVPSADEVSITVNSSQFTQVAISYSVHQ